MTCTSGVLLLEALGGGGRERADGARAVGLDAAGEVARPPLAAVVVAPAVVVPAAPAAAGREHERGPAAAASIVIVLRVVVMRRVFPARSRGSGVPAGEDLVKGW